MSAADDLAESRPDRLVFQDTRLGIEAEASAGVALLRKMATFLESGGQILLLEEIYGVLLRIEEQRHGKNAVPVAETAIDVPRMYNKQRVAFSARQA